jgi:hypothetical protein
LQGFRLEPRGDLGVAISGFGIGMPQPAADDVDFDAGLEEVDGCRVAEYVRRDAPRLRDLPLLERPGGLDPIQ